MASGVFWVTGPRALARGVDLGTDDRVEGVIVTVPMGGRLAPLSQRFVSGTPGRLPERLRASRQHVWRE
jgi:hypothetical protein